MSYSAKKRSIIAHVHISYASVFAITVSRML